MRAARRRITSGSNRLRAAGTPLAASRWGLLFGRESCRYPPALLLRRRASGGARGSSARYTDEETGVKTPSDKVGRYT